jgi:hypothetical protein
VNSEPIVSEALLTWLNANLFDRDFYEWTSFSLGETPPAFHVLDEVYDGVFFE